MTTDTLTIKTRAKAIFCETYSYPAVPLRSIGRRCFKSALTAARQEAEQIDRLKAIPATIRNARMAELETAIGRVWMVENFRQAKGRAAALAAELAALRSVA